MTWINLTGDDPVAFEADTPLLALDEESMDVVTIEQQGEAALRVVRKEAGWVLPEKGDFPVMSAKFEKFTEKLLGAKRSWPVGKTLVAARQLKVMPDHFERRVKFLRGTDVLGDVFLGTSPGFRRIHARLEGDKHTYAIDFNAFDAPVDADQWYDTEILKTAVEEIARIDLGAYALKAGDGEFQVEGLKKNEETYAEPVRQLVERVAEVGFKEVLSGDGKTLFDKGKPIVEYTIETRDGSTIKHTVAAPRNSDHYILKSSAQPHYFGVDRDRFDKLRDTKRAQLVKSVVSG